jgi:hypothetical protein
MLNHIAGFILVLLVLQAFPITVHVYPFENSDDPDLAEMTLKIQEVLTQKLTQKHIHVIAEKLTSERVNSADEVSVIYGSMYKEEGVINIKAVLEMGLNQTRIEKTIAFNAEETLEQNIEMLSRRIFQVYEDKYFAMLQVLSKPGQCSLFINKKSLGVTPYESVYPTGKVELVLKKERYRTFTEMIRVIPGNNRFTFSLKPGKPKLWKKWYTYTFVGGWAVFAASFYFHAAYRDDYRQYHDVRSRDQTDYDRFYDSAKSNLMYRNVGLGISAGLIVLSSFNLKNYFISED